MNLEQFTWEPKCYDGFRETVTREIFEDKIGQKLISDYIDFNPKTNLDFELKMRKNDDQSQIDSYEREIKRLLLNIQYLKNDNEELNNVISFLKKSNSKLL
jgi:hypothetical protein